MRHLAVAADRIRLRRNLAPNKPAPMANQQPTRRTTTEKPQSPTTSPTRFSSRNNTSSNNNNNNKRVNNPNTMMRSRPSSLRWLTTPCKPVFRDAARIDPADTVASSADSTSSVSTMQGRCYIGRANYVAANRFVVLVEHVVTHAGRWGCGKS
jgi:hypothetical protein